MNEDRSIALSAPASRPIPRRSPDSQGLETLGRLTCNIAHEFSNVLAAIAGYAELLSHALEPPASGRNELAVIMQSCARGSELVRQLLALGRPQPAASVPIELNAVVRRLEPVVQQLAGSNVRVEWELVDELLPVLIPAQHVEQLLINLTINARDAMIAGGHLTIRTEVDASQSLPRVRLLVIDTGMGMDPDLQRQAFEPFFTTKNAMHGSGLGLAIVKSLVEQSHGHIEVFSELASGTTMTLSWPRDATPLSTS